MIMNPPGMPTIGSPDHARLVTHGRHPAVYTAMAWLAFSHLPETLQSVSRPLYLAAMNLLVRIPNDTTDLTDAMKKLVEAKDGFVRAGIHSDQGVPGPIPRPVTVVDPPRFETAAEITGDLPQWRENWPTTPAPKIPGEVGFAPRPIHHYDDPEA